MGSSCQSTRRSATGQAHGVDHEQAGRALRALLAPGGEPGRECVDEAISQVVALGVLERVDHRLGHALVGEQVAGSDAASALGRGVTAERALAGIRGHEAARVDARELAELRVCRGRDELRHGLGRRQAAGEQVEQEPAERRIGHVLRGRRAHPGARVRAAGPHSGARRRDDDAEAAARGAACGERERHERTAITSTSTTHSGRASATTTRPVKAGKTPRRRSPSTR